MFLLLSRYLKPPAEIDRVLPAHRAFLDEHYASGAFVLSGPMEPRVGGVIVTADMPRERVDAILASDPFVREAISAYDIVEFKATKMAPWFITSPVGS